MGSSLAKRQRALYLLLRDKCAPLASLKEKKAAFTWLRAGDGTLGTDANVIDKASCYYSALSSPRASRLCCLYLLLGIFFCCIVFF